MNNSNPFIPQGSVLEHDKRRSHMKLAVFCVLAVSVCGLTAMLIQGCKREQSEVQPPAETNAAPVDTSLPPVNTNTPSAAMALPPNNITNAASAPASPVSAMAPEAAGTEYVVVQGDTLGKIAKAHGVSLRALEAANPNVQPTKMKIGQKIMIPAGGAAAPTETPGASTGAGGGEIYVVKSGDTLTKIAQMHGTTVRALKAANSLTSDHIKVGDKLKIPAKAETAAPATAPTVVPPPAATSTPPGTPSGQ
jgi:LysM repeat protein